MATDDNLVVTHLEPWSPHARDHAGPAALAGLIDSSARLRLTEQIKRYARGEISGRAFLIAGHRGAGKTTAVLAAMQQAYDDCRSGHDLSLLTCRPLLVRLHAPSLLIEPEHLVTAAADSGQSARKHRKTKASDDVARAQYHSRRFLQEMAAGIFPALVDELGRSLRQKVPHAPEMVAYLCDELARGMTLAELRDLFKRLGLLPQGVLGKADAYQELVAFHSASEAYLVVTGKLETEANDGRRLSDQTELRHKLGFDSSQLVAALTPLMAAAATSVGLVTHQLAAGLAVAAGVLASGFTWSRARTRIQDRTVARSQSFKRDHTHESLIRRVPLLIEQLWRVGFPIVFVVDELDKLRDPSPQDLLEWLMRNLKSYVTERAFLCFLVNRDHYEQITRRQTSATPSPRALYGVEHTFYSDAAYVVFTADAFHRHLRTVLKEDQRSSAAQSEQQLLDQEQRQLRCALLRHVILYRARMHAYDVKKEIQRAVDTGELRTALSSAQVVYVPLEPRYRAFVQLCIEWIMAEPLLRRRALDDAYLMQLQLDLLYGICEQWQRAETLTNDSTQLTLANSSENDRLALREARSALIEYLCKPELLLKHIDTERSLERLESFLVTEEDNLTPAVFVGELPEAQRKRPEKVRVGACYASRKYKLVQQLNRAVKPILNCVNNSWTDHFRGPDEVDQKQLDAFLAELQELRDNALVQTLEIDIGTLWRAIEPALTPEQLDKARDDWDAAAAPEAADFIERFVAAAPAILEVMQLSVLGLALLSTIQQHHNQTATAVPLPPRLMERWTRAIQSTTTESRRKIALGLVLELSKLHGITLPEELLQWWQHTAKRPPLPNDLALLESLRRSRRLPEGAETRLRKRFYELLVLRLTLSMRDSTLSEEFDNECRALDVSAAMLGWMPPALDSIWNDWARPNEWPIILYSELLYDPESIHAGDKLGRKALRMFAAAQLGLLELAAEAMAELKSEPSESAVGQMCSWAKQRLAHLPRLLGRVVLVNPDHVMRAWRPAKNLATLVTSDNPLAAGFADKYKAYNFVLSGTDTAAPSGLAAGKYVIIRSDQRSGASTPWQMRSDGTLVLYGPATLTEAMRWISEASRASKPA